MAGERIVTNSSSRSGPLDLRLYNIEGTSRTQGVIRMRCPHCRHNTRLDTFEVMTADIEVTLVEGTRSCFLGVRHCPDTDCGQIVFVVYDFSDGPRLLFSAPIQTLDFDDTNLPPRVAASLREAAICFAQGCFTASAIMIRKTLEEVCADRGAEGSNLKQRIAALGTDVIAPRALLEGLDTLRLLGNDAAHIESNTFEEIGYDEVFLSFEVVKEFLKAIYQYEALIEGLQGLKRKQEATSQDDPV